MNNKEFIFALASRTKYSSREVNSLVGATVSAIVGELMEGNAVTIPSFGTFEVRERAARKGRNPRSGEEIDIKASKLPSFKAGKGLKEACNF